IAKERDCKFISGNDAAGKLFEQEAGGNFSPDSIPKLRRYFEAGGRELSGSELPMQKAVSGNVEIRNAEVEVLLPSGKRIVIMGNAIPLRDESGSPRGSIAAFLDVSELKKAEADLRVAATAIESQQGILITDAERRIIRVNHAFTAVTGYEAEESIGRKPDFIGADLDEEAEEAVLRNGKWSGEMEGWDRGRSPVHMLLTVTAVKDPHGSVANYVYNFIDVSAKKNAEAEIEHLAFHDQLTDLPNRRLMMDRLTHAQATSMRSGRHCALLLLDLDNFKSLNDTQGHAMGDMVLVQAASRLAGCIREEDTVCRFGGDEFMVLLEDLDENAEEATVQVGRIGEKILAALDAPYGIESQDVVMTCSIGATLFIDHERGNDDFIRQADIALYQAKRDGRNALRFFDKRMQESIDAGAAMERELRSALSEGRFRLYCQAQVDGNGKPLGAEALLRWDHPGRGLVGPDEFIPFAEESSLILEIGNWVLETACARLASWQDKPETADLVLSVNVSVRQLRQASFPEEVGKFVVRHAIDPCLLRLELTERVLLEDSEDAIDAMKALKGMGVRLSLDDFGTGYS
ncbi:MAG TPA: diguanylate cyclase, partial [Burkholderiales bacterium]|nr:diguanylate cyclase [Burkholderiales bacterium]